MKQKHMTVIAVACGALCALCVALFMASVQGEADAARAEALARYGGEQVEVCVATRDIAAGDRIDASAVQTKLWIADLLPADVVRDAADIIGKTASSSVLEGEAYSAKRFEASRDALIVPAGKVAVSVSAKSVQAVGGAIRPGMSIDVYASGDSTTTAIANDVQVLDTSMGKSGSASSSESGWITLAVDSEGVQQIVEAAHKSDLYFTLPGEPVGADGGQEASIETPPMPQGGFVEEGRSAAEEADREAQSSASSSVRASDSSGQKEKEDE